MPNVNELFNLHGKVAIVTGGGTHLGRAMATAFGELGASVAIASRRKELCEQVAAELRDEGLECSGYGCDVTVEEQVDELVNTVVEKYGRLDIMVCNAGGSAMPPTYVPNASIEEFRSTVDANMTSAYICANSAAKVMVPQRSGSIITIGSIHGSLTSNKAFYEGLGFKRGAAAYQTAKAGIINLTRHLAGELGEYGIRANCISPGQLPRPDQSELFVQRALENIPLNRMGTPEDLKGAAVLLASDAGGFMTGHNLIVDGGWSIW
jgi:NAD(P)-dependent dehydrogenase (short-subunit alcohol dehydrogenase family)